MLKISLEKANDQNLASALQKLASLEKIDAKIGYRAGRIFDALSRAMRDHHKDMEKARKEFVVLENGSPKMSKEGNVIWNAPDAQEKYGELFKETLNREVEIKSLPLEFSKLEKIEALSGTDRVALEIVSEGVPSVA